MSLISFHECFGCCDFQSADCAINITDHKLPSNFVNGHVLTMWFTVRIHRQLICKNELNLSGSDLAEAICNKVG